MTERKIATAARAIKNVAVIGVGSIGNPIARHIHAAGFELTVCDKNSTSLEEFAALGVRTTATPSDCAECDAVIVLVATPDQVRDVTLGEAGLQSGISAGKLRYLVVMSTVAAQTMRELETAFAGPLTRVVDAPVSGGLVSAQKGTLTILAGGAEADIAVLRPLFESMGKNIFYCGPPGAGQTTKIVNNVIAISNLMISAEAYRIALANGLTLERLIPALEAGSARNFLSRDPGDAPEVYAAWSRSVDEYGSVQSINRKDIDLALSIGAPDLSLPAITALRELLEKTGDETLANWRVIGDQGSPSGCRR